MDATNLAAASRLLWNIIDFYGRDPAELFRQEGLDPDKMGEPHARFPILKVNATWNRAAALIADPCFGLKGARAWHPSMLGALGYAWLASLTLRDGFDRLSRYSRTVSDSSRVSVTETDTGLEICTEHLHTSAPPAAVDAWFAACVDMCRMNYGDTLDPIGVNLRRPKPPCAGQYFALFRCPVSFSAPKDSFTLPLDAVDRPLPSANRELAGLHDRIMAETLRTLHRSGLVTLVKRTLIERLPSGNVTEAMVAEALGLSQRTLQRKLSDEGTSFGRVFEVVRKELAMDYVADTEMSLIEISYLLGFSEASSFSRAFKRWTGKAPRAVRSGAGVGAAEAAGGCRQVSASGFPSG